MKNATIAMPPSSAKIGAPSTPADEDRRRATASSGAPFEQLDSAARAQTPATMPSAAMARAHQCGDARHASRSRDQREGDGKGERGHPDRHVDAR